MQRVRFGISGRVIHGMKLGRKLGYPTANLVPDGLSPELRGIFAVWVSGGPPLQSIAAGVASLGTRPTVGGTGRLLEIHLLDFEGDLYGLELHVDFVACLRNEQKFPDLEALKAQMRLDDAEAREILRSDSRANGVLFVEEAAQPLNR